MCNGIGAMLPLHFLKRIGKNEGHKERVLFPIRLWLEKNIAMKITLMQICFLSALQILLPDLVLLAPNYGACSLFNSVKNIIQIWEKGGM
jgi:hypothetical protein